MGGLGLADTRDVVFLAFHRHQADVGDQVGTHQLAAMGQLALGQQVLLEDNVDGLEVEFFGQVQHRQILVIEFQVLVGAVAVTLHQVLEVALVGFLVLGLVHTHEAGQLHEARIDAPANAHIGRRHGVDHVGLEPGEGLFLGQVVGHGRRQARIDRRAHEGHAGRARGMVLFGHQGGGGQNRRSGLADGDHVGTGAQNAQHLDDVVDIVVEVEAALQHRHFAGVDPVDDEHRMVGQEGLDRTAQQGGVVA